MPDLLLFISQLVIILVAARLTGYLFRMIHQPQVVGEMVAGIILGPSLFGWIAPNAFNFIFPEESLGFIAIVSQLGLIVFMFLIGLELDLGVLKSRRRTAMITSPFSVLLPLVLGILLAVMLYPRHGYSNVPFAVFALFIGVAMSITAFPVLARILTERKLMRTELGAVAIACAALNDVTGWIILALAVLLARSGESGLPLWITIIGIAIYLIVMIGPLRGLMRRLETNIERRGEITQDILAIILAFAMVSAWATEWLGIHALFGAFVAGVVMPRRHGIVHALIEKLNDYTVVLLLPLFFAYTGLRTSIGLLNSSILLFETLMVILVAVVGKYAGATFPARATGMTWREAGALGALMNTRGLMELVLLNIGLDIGVISPTVFTMLVIMALVTTFMTSPAVEWIYFRRLAPHGEYSPTAPDVLSEADCEEIIAVE